MHATNVMNQSSLSQRVCLAILSLMFGMALVRCTPFLGSDDMKKIKDLVDAELLKREIDTYVKQRMDTVAQPAKVYKKAVTYFASQMEKIKPALLENFHRKGPVALPSTDIAEHFVELTPEELAKAQEQAKALEEIKALELAKAKEVVEQKAKASKALEEEILAQLMTTVVPKTAAPTKAPVQAAAPSTTGAPTNEIPQNENVDELFHQAECIDMYETQKCKILRDEFDMCGKDRMKEMCRETCGFCPKKAYMYIDCHKTKFGCCADSVHAKNDPLGSQCCVDKIPELCEGEGNVNDCNSIEFVGNWMRKYCKKTCQICTIEAPRCEDDPEQHVFCPSWKEDGLCQTVPDLMMKHCRASCGLCPPDEKSSFKAFLAHERRR